MLGLRLGTDSEYITACTYIYGDSISYTTRRSVFKVGKMKAYDFDMRKKYYTYLHFFF